MAHPRHFLLSLAGLALLLFFSCKNRDAPPPEELASLKLIRGDVLPAGELLGDMFMELKQPRQALAAYETDMIAHPNRFNGLYGAAMAARACGEPEKAKRYFQKLLVNSTNGLRERPELETASTYLTRS